MILVLKTIIMAVLHLLPDSPFQAMGDFVNEIDFLSYLNWFVPFDNALAITHAWASAILAYYLYDTVSATVRKFIIDKLG